ncbi:MAG: tyrosine-type recombinase/integrase [Deltaproteobacteria bacterium]|nr:tyrosine-type recombinase/integrase [Deltaproteobacteria bacterium]
MGLFKRGRVWWMRFSYNGRQIKRSTEVRDKKLAEKIHAKVTTQIAEGKWFDVDEGRRRTFTELAEKYESTEFKELKSWRTVESYLNGLKKFFGPYRLSEINPALIDDFKQMRKAKVTPATINRQLNILKRMFNLARKRWMWIRDVPPIEMELKADRKRTRHLSFEQYQVVLDCCEDWLKGIVTVAAWTGLRQGNIVSLKRDQVNIFARTISVDGSETKNGENLSLPIAEPALEAIKEAMKAHHFKSLFIFCQKDGKPYHKRVVQKGFKAALEKAGIEDFRFHDLRHCFASWNRQAGVDIDTLADLMGHKDTRMTRGYAHINQAHLAGAIGKLEESYREFSTFLEQSIKKGASRNRLTP